MHHRRRSEDEEELLSSPSSGSDSASSKDSEKSDEGSSDESTDDEEKASHHRPAAASTTSTRTILIVIIALLLALLLGFAGYKAYESMSDATSTSDAVSTSADSSAEGGSAGGATATKASSGGAGSGSTGGSGGTTKGTATTSATKAGSSGASTAAEGQSGALTKTAAGTGDGSSTTSSAAASSTSSGGIDVGVSTPKKGVGYNNASYTDDLAITWAYNWNSQTDALQAGIEYIPMLWGEKQVDGWSDNAAAAISAGASYVLGFNEPDMAEQANLSPSAAVTLWNANMQSLGTSAKLVSPAVTNGVGTDDAPLGVPWLQKFISLCTDCQIDAVALHWYDTADNTAYFKSYFEESYKTLQKPIWITEFMGIGDADAQKTFIEEVVPWLEDQDYIQRYAAFGDFADNPIANFVTEAGVLLPLGQAYSDTT
ncbi:glycosyl hydrolase catalytic core-domain-containing protein [Leucosporidium creatinivorum]|uniref:Glycosyl hydrolase catalytic core-domain-containing protein n=1 Tax=Leucosporidium creatinivorum TaxID=106004 RepID=A0A1Y2D592_9BASI|nr:glycosyl hydrolase catalytic core-domain-containing protein [Leucosporidium creatinivorum]